MKYRFLVQTAETLDAFFFPVQFFSSDSRDFHYIVEAELGMEVGIACQKHDTYFVWVTIIFMLKT